MIWMSKILAMNTMRIEILPKVLSDHNPVIWTKKGTRKNFHWILNKELLYKEEDIEHIRKETEFFFETNWDTDTKPHIIWEAYKAVIRGVLIALNFKEKRMREARIKELQSNLKDKEKELTKRPRKKKLITEIKVLQEQINGLLNIEILWKSKYLKQKRI